MDHPCDILQKKQKYFRAISHNLFYCLVLLLIDYFLLFFCRASGRIKSVSQGSGGYDSDSVEMHPMEDCPEAQYYHMQCRLGEGGYERSPGCGGGGSRNWGLRKQAIQNWQRRPYRNSTEGEEGDVSDVGSRTTESEVEMWEQERRAVAEVQQSAAPYPHHSRAGYRPNAGKDSQIVSHVLSPI